MQVQTEKRDSIAVDRRRMLGRMIGLDPEEIEPATTPWAAHAVPPSSWTDVRLRLLRRATYGMRSADVASIRTMGYQQWLNEQVNWQSIDDSAVDTVIAGRYPMLSQTPQQLSAANFGTLRAQLQDATLYRAAFSERQLYERMVEFWSDHFNISTDKVGYLKAIDDREVIRKHAMGKFGDLLRASAKSPAMLAYLDQNLSRSGSPNQNYVRELMELHTLGVDGGYTQKDVEELARVFTGWTFTGAGEFFFNPARHDFGAKTVLGVQIPASPSSTGAAAVAEGETMLTVLINHPSTGRFLAEKMLKWLLTPTPSTAQIEAIAGAYRATGGDIRLMVRAILNENWMTTAPVKLKRPFHLVASALRNTNPVVNNMANMTTQVRVLGQPLFQYETPDGYPDSLEYWVGNITPRWAFGTALSNSASATNINLDVAPLLAGSRDAVVDWIETEMFGGELSLSARNALLTYVRAGTFNATRVRETIGLAISMYEFQWY